MKLDDIHVSTRNGNKMCSAGVSGACNSFVITYRLFGLMSKSLANTIPVPDILFQQIVCAAVTAQRVEHKKLEDVGKTVEELYTNLHSHTTQDSTFNIDNDNVERLQAALIDLMKEFYTSALQRKKLIDNDELRSEQAWSLSEVQSAASKLAADDAAFLADVADTTYKHTLKHASIRGQSFAYTRAVGFSDRAKNATWHLVACEEYAKQQLRALKEVQKTNEMAEEHISHIHGLIKQLPNNFL